MNEVIMTSLTSLTSQGKSRQPRIVSRSKNSWPPLWSCAFACSALAHGCLVDVRANVNSVGARESTALSLSLWFKSSHIHTFSSERHKPVPALSVCRRHTITYKLLPCKSCDDCNAITMTFSPHLDLSESFRCQAANSKWTCCGVFHHACRQPQP